ncbi:VOC family protein [Micromonospora halophytica]|uniref:Glyoxalase-like domain-containing protein n=1 Tax=Micromonospora halophytica TaxID=47864 RepID=A0A1C5HSN8_9ACTN|nr:VOC family protein [Micromonospora halophytica]SCG48958.1 Glyoxalase-like domain-containing protein [Micromonospora halophytica]
MTANFPMHLGGVVIGSNDPDRLAAWYRAAFLPDAPEGYAIEFAGGRWIFAHRDDVAAQPAEPGRVILNLYVEDIRAVESHLETLGVTWIRKVEKGGPGMIGTLEDADGNYLQLVEVGDTDTGH